MITDTIRETCIRPHVITKGSMANMSFAECIIGAMCIAIELWSESFEKTYPTSLLSACPGIWIGLFLLVIGTVGIIQNRHRSEFMNQVRLVTSILFVSLATLFYSAFLTLSVYHGYAWSCEQVIVLTASGVGVVLSAVHLLYSFRLSADERLDFKPSNEIGS